MPEYAHNRQKSNLPDISADSFPKKTDAHEHKPRIRTHAGRIVIGEDATRLIALLFGIALAVSIVRALFGG